MTPVNKGTADKMLRMELDQLGQQASSRRLGLYREMLQLLIAVLVMPCCNN